MRPLRSVDLVTDLVMTREPDEVAALVPFEIRGIDPVRYRADPLADHVADKVCAFLEVYPRALGPAQPSTRYCDLADLALTVHTPSIPADDLRGALASEVRRRTVRLGHLGPERPDVVGVTDHRLTAPVAREQTAVPDRLE